MSCFRWHSQACEPGGSGKVCSLTLRTASTVAASGSRAETCHLCSLKWCSKRVIRADTFDASDHSVDGWQIVNASLAKALQATSMAAVPTVSCSRPSKAK